MKVDAIYVHFGELSTKGNNQKQFINCLARNIRHALKDYPTLKIDERRDFILVNLHDEDPESVMNRLLLVAGIQRLSLVYILEKDYQKIASAVVEIMEKEEGHTFKIKAHRVDKTFPISSMDLSAKLGGEVLRNVKRFKVDVHNPDVLMRVDIKSSGAYLYCHERIGLGGYPLGMNGKVTTLLSGGIDSPVAAYSLIRRGIKVECLHFASPPYTSEAVLDKLVDLLEVLSAYQEDIRLEVIPFTKLQEAIYRYVAEPYCITIMRRMMLRIAARCKEKNHALGIATGESIGQVASQTLESLGVINEVTNVPILRPLATSDKIAIINEAKRLGTYEISIRPYEDCCTIFKPKNPKTKPSLEEARFYESKFDYETLIDEAVANSYSIYIRNGAIIKDERNQDE